MTRTVLALILFSASLLTFAQARAESVIRVAAIGLDDAPPNARSLLLAIAPTEDAKNLLPEYFPTRSFCVRTELPDEDSRQGLHDDGCYAFQITDTRLDPNDVKALSVHNLGVIDNIDFVVVSYDLPPSTDGSSVGDDIRIKFAVYEGWNNFGRKDVFASKDIPAFPYSDPYSAVYEFFDRRLNRHWQQLLGENENWPDSVENLREAQRQWIHHKQSTCAALSAKTDPAYFWCSARQTAARDNELLQMMAHESQPHLGPVNTNADRRVAAQNRARQGTPRRPW